MIAKTIDVTYSFEFKYIMVERGPQQSNDCSIR